MEEPFEHRYGEFERLRRICEYRDSDFELALIGVIIDLRDRIAALEEKQKHKKVNLGALAGSR